MPAKRRLLQLLLAAALCLGLFQPLPAAAADLYFTALDDNLQPLTADTMPTWSGGTLYVPYSVFDSNLNNTGVDLGIATSYQRGSNTLTLYNMRKILVFDLDAGTCRDDLTGQTYPAHAIIRNNRPYVPVATVCSFFGLSYTYNAIPQGYLVRIKTSAVVLSDETFIDAANDSFNRRMREYYQSLAPSTDSGNATPSTPSTPSIDDPDDSPASDVRLYLAFRCGEGEDLEQILDALDSWSVCGLFLLTPQVISQEPDLVRRILGTGHSVGILAEGADAARTRLLLEEGAALLEQLLHTQTTIVCVPSAQRAAFQEQGWVCWDSSLSMSPSDTVGAGTFSANVLRRLEGRSYRVYLTLPGGENTARILPTLLRQLDANSYTVSVPMETRL